MADISIDVRAGHLQAQESIRRRGWLSQALAFLTARWQSKRQANMLRNLDARQLVDIGVDPASVASGEVRLMDWHAHVIALDIIQGERR